MNPLYTLVETVINQFSTQAIEQLVSALNENPGDYSKEYACGENLFYVLKRMVTASLARDPKIKDNVLKAINHLNQKVTQVQTVNKPVFQEFFLSATDLSDCKSKQEKAAYIQGKLNVLKALPQLFHSSDKVAAHLVQLCNDNQNLQEELIEGIFGIVGDKIKALKISPAESSNAKILLNILCKKTINKQTIQTLLTSAIEQYPKESIAITHLGLNLATILPSPQQFFSSQYAQFTNTSQQQTEDGDLKRLYYLLQIQKYFLKSVIIGPQNVTKYLCTEMAVVWLEQLRVKNKHMRKVASEITISFDPNPQFALQVLQLLHSKKVYLENISQNHPFAQLYANVDTVKFWTYIIELINASELPQNKDQILEEQQEQKLAKRQEYFSELEYITRERVSDLTPEQIGKTLTILIKAYQQSKRSQKLLNLVWSLFHALLTAKDQKKKSKKKIVLNLRGPLILSKIALNELQLESQIVQILNKVTKFLRVKVKAYKEQANAEKLMIAFLNFVTGLIIYCIVYPQEADVCGQVQFVFKDLQVLLAKQKGTQVTQEKKKGKKGKSEQVEDIKKPVHVLVDVFISLLTKAPIFLRNSINLVFEQLVPFVQTSDLDTLLDVILKPDQEYIEEI